MSIVVRYLLVARDEDASAGAQGMAACGLCDTAAGTPPDGGDRPSCDLDPADLNVATICARGSSRMRVGLPA